MERKREMKWRGREREGRIEVPGSEVKGQRGWCGGRRQREEKRDRGW